jgi:hypothetical protein
MCRRLGLDEMAPCVMRAAAQLVHDRVEPRAQDDETRHRWHPQQGKSPDKGDVRQRIA